MRIERIAEDDWARLRAIRLDALASDPDAFGTTHAQCVPWPESRWRDQLRVLATFLAVDADRDVGMVRGLEHEILAEAVHLVSMWVHPDARRRGVGRTLIDAVCEWARSVGRPNVYLDVREHNTGAIALYKRVGFIATGHRAPEPPPDDHRVEAQYVLRLG